MFFLRSHPNKKRLLLNGIASLFLAAPSFAQNNSNRPSSFRDIDDHWAEVCIQGVGNEGLMKGYLDSSFRPYSTMTRAEFAAVIVKAFPDAPVIRAAPNFSDVSSDFWGKRAISAAYERGFLAGYPDNLLKPAQPISRAQAIIVIASTQNRFLQQTTDAAADAAVLSRYFQDANSTPEYAQPGVAKATRNGLVVAYPKADSLRPNDNINRGEATALLCRLNQYGSDARHYVESDYVAAFGEEFDADGLPTASRRPDPVAIESFNTSPSGSLFSERLSFGDQLFFTDDSGEVVDLWKTDGTAEGTQLVRSLISDNAVSTKGAKFVGVGKERLWILTARNDSGNGQRAGLWSSDRTTGITQEVADFSLALANALSQAKQTKTGWYTAQALDERIPLFIEHKQETQLWITDGKSDIGTQQLATFATPASQGGRSLPFQQFATTDDYVFFLFAQGNGAATASAVLWRTDGTPEGTLPLRSVGKLNTMDSVLPWGNQVYFTATTPEAGKELWVSNGTKAGTRLLKDIYLGPNSSLVSIIGRTDEAVFMLANSSEGQELWATEGAPESTRLVKKIGPPAQIITGTIYPGDSQRLFFNAAKEPWKTEMWVTDGTTSGTQPVLFDSMYPFGATAFKEQFFFPNASEDGTELWVSSGTESETYQLANLTPTQTPGIRYPCDPIPGDTSGACSSPVQASSSTSPNSLTVLGDFLYFTASGSRLFRTDGTVREMELMKTMERQNPSRLVALDQYILFATYGDRPQLWSISADSPIRQLR